MVRCDSIFKFEFRSSGNQRPNQLSPRGSHSASAPVSPCRTPRDGDCFDHLSSKDTTNVDPMSAAAMGLDHFKSKTTYGFEHLKEKPHTRRKESLFHSGGGEILINTPSGSGVNRSMSLKAPSVEERGSDVTPHDRGFDSPQFSHVRRKSSKRRNVTSVIAPLGVVTPDQHGADSTPSSAIPGRLLLTPSDSSSSDIYDRLSPVSPRGRYFR